MSTLPKFFMDAEGYCYPATASLAARGDMRPWNGFVDAAGYAIEPPQIEQVQEPAQEEVTQVHRRGRGLRRQVQG